MGIVCLNLFVLFLSFPAMPQKNSLSLIRHLEKSPEIAAVTKRRKTQILIPSALLSRDFKIRKLTDKKLENLNHENCRGHYVFRYDDLVKGRVPNGLKKIAEFSPSVVDAWVVALNPKRNARRGSLSLYQCPEIQRSQ